MKKRFFIVLTLLLMALAPVFSSSGYYEKGDTVFSFKGGINLPDFFIFTNNSTVKTVSGVNGMHLYIGGSLGLSYQVFLTDYFALGGGVSYNFNSSYSKDLFVTVNLSAKITYYPVQTEKFDLGLSADAGISYFRYSGGKYVSPLISLSVSPTYFFNKSFGLGLDLGVYMNWDFYFTSSSNNKSLHNALSIMSPITIRLTYRH